MKFVCDNCQAKYQIGDEKVAGKTVRMKCRKCAFEIVVRAGSPGTGADAPAGEMDAPMPMSLSSSSLQAVSIGPVAGHAVATAPPVSSPGLSSPRAPVAAPAPRPLHAPAAPPAPRVGPAPRAPVPAPAAAAPTHQPAPAAPRPATSAPRPAAAAAPRPVIAARPAGAPSPARPVTRVAGTSSAAMAAVRPAVEEALPPQGTWGGVDDESTALFGMGHAPAADAGPEHAPASAAALEGEADWYVGIAGTPLGPVHATVIRDRALAGDVDGESLVWREGLAEWRPLRTFPELVQLMAAAQYAYPATPAPRAVPPPAASVPIALVTRAAPHAVAAEPFAPTAPSAPQSPQNGKSNGYHATPHAPAAFVPDDAPRAQPVPVAPAPAATVPAAPAAIAAPVQVAPIEAPVSQPVASAPAPSAALSNVGPKVEIEADLDIALGRKRGGAHPMAYAFIAAAAVFGGVAAWVLLSKPQTQIVVVQQVAATSGTAAASGAPAADSAQVEVGEISPANPQGPTAKTGGPLARPKPSSTAVATAASSTPIDTSGFNNSVPGPAATGPSGSQQGGGGQLSQGEIGAVVSQNQPLVKRKCWQPALEARPPTGPTNARVNGSITIGASGQVESASANGGERDFPGLSSCIASRMKNWKFPPSGGPTSVNVPFVFAGQ
jgi:predicted Zn finger-like uncharacterized protein